MKIKALLLIGILTCSTVFTACGNDSGNAPTEEKTTAASDTAIITVETTAADAYTEIETTAADAYTEIETAAADAYKDNDTVEGFLEPVMQWWELYNPNGFDTLTAVITNPNDVDVDISYDIVFYKDGSEVSRIEYCDSFSVAAGGETLIWANVDVPAAEDADGVKLENVYVSEAGDPAIGGSYEYVGVIDGAACFDFSFDSKPTLATIWFVLYNDDNGNGKFDKGEISVVDTAYLMEQTGRASFDVNVHPYTDFEVYFTAY